MTARILPRHVAIIMDGNGRWAKSRGFLRLRGHEEGAEALRRITRHAAKIRIGQISFFALSTENFRRRPRAEVDFLMRLLKDYLIRERAELAENNIRLTTIGHVEEFPPDVVREMEATVKGSAHHTGMVLRLALNYGSRQEMAEAARRIAELARDGGLDPASIDEESFRRFLFEPSMPDPDLIIRTAGELRLSNFFLWQASYSELWAAPVFWPEFDVSHFEAALDSYALRQRKFGSLDAGSPPPVAAPSRPLVDSASPVGKISLPG